MNTQNAFMTHHGIKVRLNPQFCLQYLKEENVLNWFISIEAFDSFRGFLSIIGTIILMFSNAGPVDAGFKIMLLYIFGFYVSQSYTSMVFINLVYGLIFMVYEKIMRFFIPEIVLVVVMFITKQYMIFVSYVAVRLFLYILITIINMIRSKIMLSKYGVYVGDVEITAIKLLKFYSEQEIVIKKWIQNYSKFLEANHESASSLE